MNPEILEAIQILLWTHIRRDPYEYNLPIIRMGAVPESYDTSRYTQAWTLLWEKFDPENAAKL
jgi:hypothetical protein